SVSHCRRPPPLHSSPTRRSSDLFPCPGPVGKPSPSLASPCSVTRRRSAAARRRARPDRMPTPLLEVSNLRVEFPGRRGTLVALDDVSFSIAPGEILGVVGESGAGKSLTGAAIIGLLDPPGRIGGGAIRFDGRRIDNLPYEDMRKMRGRSIGAIFQDPLTSLDPL